jgi:hypothetical protein
VRVGLGANCITITVDITVESKMAIINPARNTALDIPLELFSPDIYIPNISYKLNLILNLGKWFEKALRLTDE